MVPEHLHPLFWDIDIKKFNPLEYPRYTISRVLEFGDEKSVTWIKELFSIEQIKDVIKSEHRLTRRSANFWAFIYGIPSSAVAALKKQHGNFYEQT